MSKTKYVIIGLSIFQIACLLGLNPDLSFMGTNFKDKSNVDSLQLVISIVLLILVYIIFVQSREQGSIHFKPILAREINKNDLKAVLIKYNAKYSNNISCDYSHLENTNKFPYLHITITPKKLPYEDDTFLFPATVTLPFFISLRLVIKSLFLTLFFSNFFIQFFGPVMLGTGTAITYLIWNIVLR